MSAFIQITNERSKRISLPDLSTVPKFVRFDAVKLFYNRGSSSKTIEEKCQKIGKYLHPIKKAALKDSTIRFLGKINQGDRECFSDHSMLLEHLRVRLLPICDSSRRYEFSIDFLTDKEAATNVFSAILQMPQIRRCANLEIRLCLLQQPMQFPVEEISNWLNRQVNAGMEVIGEIFLQIFVTRIQNAVGICDYLETVSFKKFIVSPLNQIFDICFIL